MSNALPQPAVSTWSLHRTLGKYIGKDSAFGGGPFMPQAADANPDALLMLIPELKKHDYPALQICHFHLESREPDYLHKVRMQLETHGITLDALLIDDGDLSAEDAEQQLAWYDNWLDAARLLGAKRARICAGRSAPTDALLRRSGKLLAQLANRHPDVRIVTENWMEMIPDARSLFSVLEAAGNDVGLLIDLGNWSGSAKYDQLELIADRAETCHAKCAFTEDGPDVDDFRQALGILKEAGFRGPLALIYDGPDPDEWAGLDTEWGIVRDVFQ